MSPLSRYPIEWTQRDTDRALHTASLLSLLPPESHSHLTHIQSRAYRALEYLDATHALDLDPLQRSCMTALTRTMQDSEQRDGSYGVLVGGDGMPPGYGKGGSAVTDVDGDQLKGDHGETVSMLFLLDRMNGIVNGFYDVPPDNDLITVPNAPSAVSRYSSSHTTVKVPPDAHSLPSSHPAFSTMPTTNTYTRPQLDAMHDLSLIFSGAPRTISSLNVPDVSYWLDPENLSRISVRLAEQGHTRVYDSNTKHQAGLISPQTTPCAPTAEIRVYAASRECDQGVCSTSDGGEIAAVGQAASNSRKRARPWA